MLSSTALRKLDDVDSILRDLVVAAERVIPLTIIEGHRGQAAQEKAFAEGKTQLHWPNGKHNSLPSMAVDLAPLNHNGTDPIDWNDLIAFGRIMGVMQALAWQRAVMLRFGFDWDGDYRSVNRDSGETFMDAPHVERVPVS